MPESTGRISRIVNTRLFTVARVAVTVAIIAGLVIKLSPEKLGDTARGADLGLLAAAGGMMLLVQAMVVVKWRTLLNARDLRLPALTLARVYCIGNLLTTVLPTSVGGDVYRVYRLQRGGEARAADVTMSVLYERATGYGAMTCLGALGAAFHYGSAAVGALALGCGAVAALALAVVLPRAPFPAVRSDHFLRNLLAHRRELMAVYEMTVFSLVIQALYISTIALAGRAFGIQVSWWYWAFATWVVAVATLLPLTLGGLGVRESSFSALLERAGATAAQGAATGFALAVLLVAANGLGLLAIEVAERLGFGAATVPPIRRGDAANVESPQGREDANELEGRQAEGAVRR